MQLFRRVRRFRIKILSFTHLGMYIKVNHAFKAKEEAFRGSFCAKVGDGLFSAHLTLQKLDRDESRFLMKIFQNLVPNSNLRRLSAQLNIFHSNRDFACSLLVKNPMEFQWFWSPFAHFPSVTHRETLSPAGPGSTQEILSPCGAPPPHSNQSY